MHRRETARSGADKGAFFRHGPGLRMLREGREDRSFVPTRGGQIVLAEPSTRVRGVRPSVCRRHEVEAKNKIIKNLWCYHTLFHQSQASERMPSSTTSQKKPDSPYFAIQTRFSPRIQASSLSGSTYCLAFMALITPLAFSVANTMAVLEIV